MNTAEDSALGEPISIPEQNTRKPWIAFLLSLLTPGLGQMYNGQIKKSLSIIAVSMILLWTFGLTRWVTHFYGFITFLILEASLVIYIIVDATRTAMRIRLYEKKKYNTWYFHLLGAAIIISLSFLFNTQTVLKIRTLKTPSVAGAPVRLTGDYSMLDFAAYKSRRPDYGDIIAFTHKDGLLYAHRIVGLPNDIINVRAYQISINGEPCGIQFLNSEYCEEMQVKKFEETLPNGHKHQLFYIPNKPDTTNLTFKVPANSYFLMGDHRDNSMDSRYIGSIPEDKIEGRIVFNYWGEDMSRINVDFRTQ